MFTLKYYHRSIPVFIIINILLKTLFIEEILGVKKCSSLQTHTSLIYIQTSIFLYECKIKIQVKLTIEYNEHTLSTSSQNAQTNISLTLNSFASYNLSPIHY